MIKKYRSSIEINTLNVVVNVSVNVKIYHFVKKIQEECGTDLYAVPNSYIGVLLSIKNVK